MASSFNVNVHDLEFMLRQIKIAEAHAGGTPLLQAIMAEYGVTASDAALLPAGLRTVDGTLNNLTPGNGDIGAADTLFPRLTDPVFLNDQDGDQMPLGPVGSGAPTITNTNYGQVGSVADADPRIISNLIVDMTAANPAAVDAALAYVGITGSAATAARGNIMAAWKNIQTTATAAHLAELAEAAALAVKTAETAEQATADAANTAAQSTLIAYGDALTEDVDAKVAAAQSAVDAMVTALGPVGSVIVTPGDTDAVDAAVAAATTAANAALAAYNALLADPNVAPADLSAAQAVSDAAALLLTQVTSLQGSLDSSTPNLDTAEFTAAASANTAAGAVASAATTNTAQLSASQATAATNATNAATALAAATAAVTQDTTDRDAAIAASNAADADVTTAQSAEIAAQAVVVAAQTAFNAAAAANAPFAQTLGAYNTALAQNLDLVTQSASNAVDTLVLSLGSAGGLIDSGDITAADAAIAAAQAAADAAADAVTALLGGPNVIADDLSDAQAVAIDAAALLLQLQGLRANLDADLTTGDQLLDLADFNTAALASTAAGTIATATTTLVPQLGVSQAAADLANQPTAATLATAASDLSAANIAHGLAVTALTDAITFAGAMQLAEDAAIADLAASVAAQTLAATANTNAQAILTAYNTALALDVEVAAAAAQTEAGQLVASLGAVGAIVDAADHTAAAEAVAAATDAADAASDAAGLLLAALGAAHADVIAAQAVAADAIALANSLSSLQSALLSSSPLLDASEFAAAQTALLQANAAETAANSTDAQLAASQLAAGAAATAAAAALATANLELAAATTAHADAVTASNAADATAAAAEPAFATLLESFEIQYDPLGSLVIPNQSPDIGLSPGFNSWMTFFGQFFDHGLDLVTKGNAGTVYIPLEADDPIIAGNDGIFGTSDDLPEHLRFMALTRATQTIVDGDPQHENTTTSWIDQNQTYTSHASHQVFLREYARVDADGAGPGGLTVVSTGRLLDGTQATGSLHGAIGTWTDVKAQAKDMLGLTLSDFDVHDVPLLVTDPYGKFIPGNNGFAQVVVQLQIVNSTTGAVIANANHVTGANIGTAIDAFAMSGVAGGLDLANLAVPGGLPALGPGQAYKVSTVGTGHAFLNDIAHHAAPGTVDLDHNPMTPKVKQVADADIDANGNGIYDVGIDTLTDVNGDGSVTTADFFAADKNPNGSLNEATYDDEMLGSHFITGDGRGNENIALTAVHSIFHSEHNRVLEANKATIIASGNVAFLNEWLLVDQATTLSAAEVQALDPSSLTWDGERLFQAARFSTEMQYQHLVFEEFARRIQPMVDPFVFNNSPNIDPSIVAEFAHTVYRFGHSMLTGTVDRLENDLTTVNGEADQQTLLAAFLNPQMYVGSGSTAAEANANLIRGLTRDLGNEIDEFIVQDLRSNLVGLPLDLAALNIARGRETGIPSLNETRRQLYDAGALDLIPYTGWTDFAQNIKNPLSVVNFIAAYGTHASLTSAANTTEMRDAAMLLVLGDGSNADGVTIRGVTYSNADRLAFLGGTGIYAGNHGGMNNVDLWIGGLAERKSEFGGMLGQTFNYVFEYQMEQLQSGDRLYYLTRTQGLNLLNNLEPNTFADMVMRNTDLGDQYATHLSGQMFLTPDHILELDRGIAQAEPDPTWDEPILGDKVVRDYTNSTIVDGNHDFGGYLKFLGGEHVVVGGTEGDDEIRTDIGDDTVWADGGNDYINSGTGADDIFGGDGDDIIEDPFGDDVLRGERGNDVISEARGFDLVFGGQGQDYILIGQDAAEAFGGTESDFILGGSGGDFLLGNEGDDWIEGGGGFDTLAGENSELFFNSTIIGHDVLFGQGDETDYDAESGDDIMGSGPSVYRYEGMFGFDWGIAKYDNFTGQGVDFDLGKPIFTTDPADILRDRFDQVEALSGWKDNDTLTGDNVGTAATAGVPDAIFDNHILTAEGIDRITGFREWFGGALTTLSGDNATSFRDGNILIGGDGNDIFKGLGGSDIIDGDAWLNVRIKIVHEGVTYSAESLSTDTTVMGQLAGKVFHTNADGSPNFSSPAFGGVSLNSLMLNGTINPGSLSIVREILADTTNLGTAVKNSDIAVFQGTFAEYEIEGSVDLNNDGDFNDAGEFVNVVDVNGDGFISVRDRDDGINGAVVDGDQLRSRRILTDDTDLLRNIEVLRFSDRDVAVGTAPTDIQWNAVTASGAALPGANEVIANLGSTDDDTSSGFTYALVPTGSSPGFTVSAAGVVTATAALVVNSTYTLNIRSTDTTGAARIETFQIRTGTIFADTIDVDNDGAGDAIVYGHIRDDGITGDSRNDTLFGQGGIDTLDGGLGNDTLVGGLHNDVVSGGGGRDRILWTFGDGIDTIDGGADTDTLVINGDLNNNVLDVVFNNTTTVVIEGGAVSNVERITADLLGGTDALSYAATTAANAVSVDLTAGTASGGFVSLAGIENVIGGAGNDTLIGRAGAINALTGGAGHDTFTVHEAGDTVVEIAGGGTDLVRFQSTTAGANYTITDADVENLTLLGAANINGTGNSSANVLTGNSGNNVLTGLAGADALNGGDGADTLIGGLGADTLTGGLGDDIFDFNIRTESDIVTGYDVITDFFGAGAAGGDVIDFFTIDANSTIAGNQDFEFIGTAAFSDTTAGSLLAVGQVRYVHSGGDTLIQVNTNNTLTTLELELRVSGTHNFVASDFAL